MTLSPRAREAMARLTTAHVDAICAEARFGHIDERRRISAEISCNDKATEAEVFTRLSRLAMGTVGHAR